MSTARIYDSKTEFSYCKEIGLWTMDLPRTTCKYKTAFCLKYCYNNKIEKQYNSIKGKDKRNLAFWESLTMAEFKDFVASYLREQMFELMTKFTETHEDFDKFIEADYDNSRAV